MQEKKDVFSNIDYLIVILFLISLLSSAAVFAFYIGLLAFLSEGTRGGVKALFWLTVRGLLSSAVGASIGTAALLKWGLLFIFAIWILNNARINVNVRKKQKQISKAALIFATYSAISSLFFSSYPLVSFFKVLSFVIPMLAIITGIAETAEYEDWVEYYYRIFCALFTISFVLIPFGRFRVVNQNFQGVFNHVNLFGILSALFIAITVSRDEHSHRIRHRGLIIAAVIVMVYLSRSRTGMFSVIGVLLTSRLFGSNRNVNSTIFMFSIVFVMTVILLAFPEATGNVGSMASAFVLKEQTVDTILASRLGQVNGAMFKFGAQPLFGSGFMTPYYPGVRSFIFSFDLIVEPGNLIYAVLGDTGVIGTILFAVLLLRIFNAGNKHQLALFVGALMINMGEMVFFSANNMSILVYYLLAVYVFGERKGEEYHAA